MGSIQTRYLWQRGRRSYFQIRPPADLHRFLGRTPIRLALPRVTAVEASRICRLLAGEAEKEFRRMALSTLAGLSPPVDDEPSEADLQAYDDWKNYAKNLRETLLARLQQQVELLFEEAHGRIERIREPRISGRSSAKTQLSEANHRWREFALEKSERLAEAEGQIAELEQEMEKARVFFEDIIREHH